MLMLFLTFSDTCFTETSTLQGDAYKLELYLRVVQAQDQNPACVNFEGDSGTAILYLPTNLPNGSTYLTSNYFIYSNREPQVFVFDMSSTSYSDFNDLIEIYHISYSVEIGISRPMHGVISKIEYIKNDISNCWKSIALEYRLTRGDYSFTLLTEPNFCTFSGSLSAHLRYYQDSGEIFNLPGFQSSSISGEFNTNYQHLSTFKFPLRCADYVGSQLEQCDEFFETLTEHLDLALYLVLDYIENGVALEVIGEVGQQYSEHSTGCFASADPDVDVYEDSIIISLVQMYGIPDCIVADFESATLQTYIFNAETREMHEQELTPAYYLRDIIFDTRGEFARFLTISSTVRFRFLLKKGSDVVHAVVREQRARVFCVYQMEAKLTRGEIDLYLRYYPLSAECSSGQLNTTASFNFYYTSNGELTLLGRSKVELNLDFSRFRVYRFRLHGADFKFSNGDFESVHGAIYRLAKKKLALVDVYNSHFFIYTDNVFIYGTTEFAIVMVCVMAAVLVFSGAMTLIAFGACGKKEAITM